MQIDIQTTFPDLVKKLQQDGATFPQLVKKALTDAAAIVHQTSLRLLSAEIYNKPETEVLRRSRKTKRIRKVKLWKRTSDLYRAEAAGADYSQLSNYRITLDNSTPYAWDRHKMSYPAKTPYRTLSGRDKKATMTSVARPNRTAHWREDTMAQAAPSARDAFRNAIAAIRGM